MSSLANFLRLTPERLPVLARVGPFAVYVALTCCQGLLGESGRYWIYLFKTLLAAWLLWVARPFVVEMKWKLSWEAVLVGVVAFGIWVGLDGFYPTLVTPGEPWNPAAHFGEGSALAWAFIAVRIAGSALVVPPMEEVFYRSFLYRYLAKPDFQSVPLGQFAWMPFLATSAIFGLEHGDRWLVGILCGLALQGLVCWKQRLGDAMTAHAVTNLLLGVWVVWKGAWHFW